ncbi:DUF4328 domain-containing protein [Streptomyces finlayi]|uniref:DUF4328 domain-containing protein n=1 Tax=Streptomyces finlayi TaxID=67296 RepID=A0A7G7BJC4_9ACTN|nr:DUF4328 domain-containing protein [Streptomyces finlayi]QNE75439.1 DUF4328 domain-containing protein [Streptomyces finlayi]
MSVPQLRSPAGLSYAAVVLLGLCALTDLFDILFSLSAMAQSGLVANPGRFDALHGALLGMQGFAFVACGIVFCAWLWRVRFNAEAFRPDGHKHSRPWIWCGWFVPFVSFWYPRRILVDVWRASAPDRPGATGTGLINLWWGLWLVCQAETAAPEMAEKDMGTSLFDTAAAYSVGFSLLDLIAACLAAAMVRRITSMQYEKAMAGPARSPEPA